MHTYQCRAGRLSQHSGKQTSERAPHPLSVPHACHDYPVQTKLARALCCGSTQATEKQANKRCKQQGLREQAHRHCFKRNSARCTSLSTLGTRYSFCRRARRVLSAFFFHSPSPAPPPSVLSNSTPQRACFYEEFFFVNSLSLFLTEGRENDCVVCAQTVQLEPCHTPTRRKDCKGSERTPCSLYHTAATAAVLCAGVCVCVRIVVSLLAVLPTDFVVTRTVEPFRLRLAAGTKGVTLLRCPRRRRRERGCRRETAGLSPPSPPLHCCSFSAKNSRRRMWGLSVQCT